MNVGYEDYELMSLFTIKPNDAPTLNIQPTAKRTNIASLIAFRANVWELSYK